MKTQIIELDASAKVSIPTEDGTLILNCNISKPEEDLSWVDRITAIGIYGMFVFAAILIVAGALMQ